MATVPNIFTPGTVISSSAMNANFAALASGGGGGIALAGNLAIHNATPTNLISGSSADGGGRLMGINCSFTPASSSVLLMLTGAILLTQADSTNGSSYQMVVGTGSPPATNTIVPWGGTANIWFLASQIQAMPVTAAGIQMPLALMAVTSVTPNQQLWVDVSIYSANPTRCFSMWGCHIDF